MIKLLTCKNDADVVDGCWYIRFTSIIKSSFFTPFMSASPPGSTSPMYCKAGNSLDGLKFRRGVWPAKTFIYTRKEGKQLGTRRRDIITMFKYWLRRRVTLIGDYDVNNSSDDDRNKVWLNSTYSLPPAFEIQNQIFLYSVSLHEEIE